ncbi:MAG: right-handed parallel beta-helix repeat-containing protein [Phycisphaerales bacterium]|nr:right-handed parallel beta-helix repeat-containing protein [Phycisphaerales bacterium]
MSKRWHDAIYIGMIFIGIGLMAVPLNAATYWVDGKNSAAADSNEGSEGSPLKTISAAVSKLRAGDTAMVRGGVYREAVKIQTSGTAEDPITVQAVPGEVVVVTGADLVSGWEKIEDAKKRPIWRKTPWKAWEKYGGNLPDSSKSRSQGPQLIVDHQLYRHVAGIDELFPGSFCYDTVEGGAIYLWMVPPRSSQQAIVDPAAQWWDNPVDLSSDDPNQHQVEASVRATNIVVANQSHVTVRGLTARYNSAHAQGAGILISEEKENPASRYNVVEDCIVEFCHGSGLSTSGAHIIARRCYSRFNGGIGGGGHLTNSLWEDNTLEGNTTLGHGHGWEAGGVKFVRSTNLTVRQCNFINNDGPGLWFDWGNSGNIIERNFCSYNSGSGIMMEVSPKFSSAEADATAVIDEQNLGVFHVKEDHPADPNIVRNNICVGNRWDGFLGSGILLQLASNTIVVNNTVIDNEQYGIFVRYHPYDPYGHRSVGNVILNNLVMNNGGSQIYITPDPQDKPGFVAGNRSDYNLFWMTSSWLQRNVSTQQKDYGWNEINFSRWGKTQGNLTYSVEEWFKIRGFDEHSIQLNPRLVSETTLDYSLRPDSPAIGAGTSSPYVNDDYLGRPRPANRPPSIGAVEYFPGVVYAPNRPMDFRRRVDQEPVQP